MVAEIEQAGFWVPLDDSPARSAYAEAARKKKEAASLQRQSRRDDFRALVVDLIDRDLDDDSPEAVAVLAKLQALAGDVVLRPGLAQWCVLVRRRSPLRVAVTSVNETVTLPDGATAIHGVMFEDLDSFAWRLAEEYAPWTAEHDDARGVPTFSSNVFGRVREAVSYEDALARLGDSVAWVVPKGGGEREAERAAKIRALVSREPTKKKAATKGKSKKKKKKKKKKKATAKLKAATVERGGAKRRGGR